LALDDVRAEESRRMVREGRVPVLNSLGKLPEPESTHDFF
jgi:hypothetical protein